MGTSFQEPRLNSERYSVVHSGLLRHYNAVKITSHDWCVQEEKTGRRETLWECTDRVLIITYTLSVYLSKEEKLLSMSSVLLIAVAHTACILQTEQPGEITNLRNIFTQTALPA